MIPRAALAAVTLAALAVAPVAAQEQEPTQRIRTRPDLITADEIAQRASEAVNAYEVVQRLRPRMLQFRPVSDLRGQARAVIQVYVDGLRQGGVEVLKTLPRAIIVEIRHLSGTDATSRFGLDHEAGAILVKTSQTGG